MATDTSIIIRTLNEAAHLERLIQGIYQQEYKDWELVLVDSGSTDGTLEIAKRHIENICHIAPHDFTYGRSLNLGCGHAHGRNLVLISAHTYPANKYWLGNLVKAFSETTIGMVYGRQFGISHIAEERHLDLSFGSTSKILIDEPAGNNANAAIRKDLWLEQQYDESLPALEDIDWAHKIQKRGYRIYYAADAAIYHIHQESLAQIYRRYRREAMATSTIFGTPSYPALGLAPRYVVSVLRDVNYGIRRKAALRRIMKVPGERLAFYLGLYYGARAGKAPGINSSGGTSPGLGQSADQENDNRA